MEQIRRNVRDLPQNLSDAAHIAVPLLYGNYPGALYQGLQITGGRYFGRDLEWPLQSLFQSFQRRDLTWSRLHPYRGAIGRQFSRAVIPRVVSQLRRTRYYRRSFRRRR